MSKTDPKPEVVNPKDAAPLADKDAARQKALEEATFRIWGDSYNGDTIVEVVSEKDAELYTTATLDEAVRLYARKHLEDKEGKAHAEGAAYNLSAADADGRTYNVLITYKPMIDILVTVASGKHYDT